MDSHPECMYVWVCRFYIFWFVNNSSSSSNIYILSIAFVRSFVIAFFILLHFAVLVSSPFTIQHTLYYMYISSHLTIEHHISHLVGFFSFRWATQNFCECIKSINWHRYKITHTFKKIFHFSTSTHTHIHKIHIVHSNSCKVYRFFKFVYSRSYTIHLWFYIPLKCNQWSVRDTANQFSK